MHLRGQRFTCSADGPFTKNIKRIKNIKETGNSRYIYQSKLDKACFHKDMPDRDVKDLNGKIIPDNVLNDKAFNITKYPKCPGYQWGLDSMLYKFFDKKTSGGTVKNETISN